MSHNPYITKYGRAVSPGQVTRKSLAVRKTIRTSSHHRPLPIELQVHPKALTPTPVHPSCDKFTTPHGGTSVHLLRALSRAQFIKGKGLADAGRYCLSGSGRTYGYTDDIVLAMGWKAAARGHGIWSEVWDTLSSS